MIIYQANEGDHAGPLRNNISPKQLRIFSQVRDHQFRESARFVATRTVNFEFDVLRKCRGEFHPCQFVGEPALDPTGIAHDDEVMDANSNSTISPDAIADTQIVVECAAAGRAVPVEVARRVQARAAQARKKLLTMPLGS